MIAARATGLEGAAPRPAAHPSLEAELAALRARMTETILPFWSTQGFDGACGLFRERLDFKARPIDDIPIRAMVQARQIYVFADAARTGLLPSGAGPAERALDSLLRRFCAGGDARQGFAFSLLRDGTVACADRDSYTHAFILFALASAYRLTGDARIRRAVDQTLGFVDRHLMDPVHAGLHDRHPEPGPFKAQNPQMHLLEACLALHEAFPEDSHLARAGAIVALFEGKLFRSAPGALPEHFAADWAAHPEAGRGDVFEPGHHFEWAWLLRRYEHLAGVPPSETSARLWETALASGLTPEGLIYDEVGLDLRPRQARHRLWPHAEAVRARRGPLRPRRRAGARPRHHHAPGPQRGFPRPPFRGRLGRPRRGGSRSSAGRRPGEQPLSSLRRLDRGRAGFRPGPRPGRVAGSSTRAEPS